MDNIIKFDPKKRVNKENKNELTACLASVIEDFRSKFISGNKEVLDTTADISAIEGLLISVAVYSEEEVEESDSIIESDLYTSFLWLNMLKTDKRPDVTYERLNTLTKVFDSLYEIHDIFKYVGFATSIYTEGVNPIMIVLFEFIPGYILSLEISFINKEE